MSRIGTVGVVGAGTMGSGIAQKLAQEGLDVVLLDVAAEGVARGQQRIADTLAEAVERKIFSPAQAEAVQGRIRGTTAIADLAACQLVIEAVFEDLEVKRSLFRQLGEQLPADTVLGTNTSSFYVREVAEVTAHPERVIGLHYFYHPAKNRLVEVVPHEGSSGAAIQRAWALQERIGKTPIASRDAPGFVVNRYFVPWLNEAVRLLEAGVATIPCIERVAKQVFRIGMGPFELMNVTGVPIALHAATTLGRELGAFYAPTERLAAQVASKELWPLDGADEGDEAEVRDRLLGTVFAVAAALVGEGVASIEDTDIGARVGLRWSIGPFELMNRTGIAEALRMATRTLAPWDLEVPARLTEQAASGAPFPVELVRLDVAGDIATITFNRPDAMNALDPTVVDQLAARFEEAKAAPGIKAIVIRGAGKAFVAGADIKWFVKRIDADDPDGIYAFTKRGQDLFASFDAAEPLVIAYLDGLSLGGGSELALACDYIVATEKGSLGFPETGIGIYPGLGGTQRLPRRVGTGLARYLIHTGQPVGAKEAFHMGLVDRLIEPGALDETVRALIADVGTQPTRRCPPEGYEELARVFDRPVAELLAGEPDPAHEARTQKAVKRLKYKAPIALRIADDLIGGALRIPLSAGLEAELGRLHEIFGTKDAYEGLTSLGRRRPTFVGA